MGDFSESQLVEIKTRLSPFGAEWTLAAGRELATVRDGIDFLAAMRDRDDFWAALEPRDPARPYPIDLTALRALLPATPLASDLTGASYLRSLGLSEDEIAEITSGLDAPDFFDAAIRSAFAQGKPQSIARALERILGRDHDVLAARQHMRRFDGSRGLVRTVGAVLVILLFLVGAAGIVRSTVMMPLYKGVSPRRRARKRDLPA